MTFEFNTDWLMGRHSKIPDCCIKFFRSWWRFHYASPLGQQYRLHWQRRLGVESVHYVPCPTCVWTKNIVKIHHCSSTDPVCMSVREKLGLR